ncbi:MAG: alpha-amylase family glycosyl hydrolase [Anaerolineae bacterium]
MATTLFKDPAGNALAATTLLTLPGVPFIYYGEEIGMTGNKPDERIRTPMQWADEANGGFTSGTPWEALNSDLAERQRGQPGRGPRLRCSTSTGG